jgi:hypothetical protein
MATENRYPAARTKAFSATDLRHHCGAINHGSRTSICNAALAPRKRARLGTQEVAAKVTLSYHAYPVAQRNRVSAPTERRS